MDLMGMHFGEHFTKFATRNKGTNTNPSDEWAFTLLSSVAQRSIDRHLLLS